MFLKAFCFLDIKTGIYSQPFFMPHRGLAIRAALNLGNDLNTDIGKHPHDFRLILVGEFDDSVGALHSIQSEDFGTVGAILAQHDRPKQLSEMTASEVIAVREAEKASA